MRRNNDFKKLENSLEQNYEINNEDEAKIILQNIYKTIHPAILKDMKMGEDPLKFMQNNLKRSDLVHLNFDGLVLLEFESIKRSENNHNDTFNPNPWMHSDFSRKDMLRDPWRKYESNNTIILFTNTKNLLKLSF